MAALCMRLTTINVHSNKQYNIDIYMRLTTNKLGSLSSTVQNERNPTKLRKGNKNIQTHQIQWPPYQEP